MSDRNARPSQPPSLTSETRAHIRAEHERLEARIVRVQQSADAVERREEGAVQALRRALRDLRVLLRGHLRFEERFLVPALRENVETGDEDARALLEEHEAQRGEMDRIIADLEATGAGAKLLDGARELARALLDDMEHEEEAYLRTRGE
ncbi:MAG: hemerythrin domain-containing protein [Myxococcales bacterium]|nr:hemerythrin domain-containing protein [Myxococcales bacterium]